jgi:DNA helicase-2/ATP-dependent DNA helicase PcrA
MVVPEKWTPVDGITLEVNADRAVRSDRNLVVVAGPGAGKTELLAQRACFLLETGACPTPRMILAISFKRDAAKTLAERVKKRCGDDLATRFHSMTYDAFAKGLVDRFRSAIPEEYRPSADYEVVTNHRHLETEVDELDITVEEHRHVIARTIVEDLCKKPLPLGEKDTDDLHTHTIAKLWRHLTSGKRPSSLTFPMLSRLAAFILQENLLLLRALRACYSHVFLDEFQDTTDIQYALVTTAFKDSDCVLTAVGDPKQRIMVWAGAKRNVIECFMNDFAAETLELFCNHRSAPRLVGMQHVFAQYLTPGVSPPTAVRTADEEGVCEVLLFRDDRQEASVVAAMIAELVQVLGLSPRDIAVLARQRVDRYGTEIMTRLETFGLRARVESELQDLLAEPVTDICLSMLRLACGVRDPVAWQQMVDLLMGLRGVYDGDDSEIGAIEQDLQRFIQHLGKAVPSLEAESSAGKIKCVLEDILQFLGTDQFKIVYPQYSQGKYLSETVERVSSHLHCYLDTSGLMTDAIDALSGKDTVPILTIHKSKGLEYDTIFFIGLDDGAFWNFDSQQEEETCAFFVAFSRAKQRVYFTFSETRNFGRTLRVESRDKVRTLYDLLEQAGAEIVDLRNT